PTATVKLKTPTNGDVQTARTGQGSVEAIYEALEDLMTEDVELIDYQLQSVGRGQDALAEAHVQLKVNGEHMNGRGSAQDVIEATSKAYMQEVNDIVIQQPTVKRAAVIKS